jgi:hypothetical protein
MHFRARVVEEDKPPLLVEGNRASPEEMVQPHRNRSKPLVGPETVDAVAVFLAEVEIPGPRIHREASEYRLPRLGGEWNHDPRRPGSVHRQEAAQVDTVELGGGISSPPLPQHYQHSIFVESELDGPRDSRDHDLDSESLQHLGARRRARARGQEPAEADKDQPGAPRHDARPPREP